MAFKVNVAGVLIMICVASGAELLGCGALSVAVTEKANVPTCVGVPDTMPSLPNVSPGGSVPLAVQV